MSVGNVTWLELLHELCLQNGYALLLTASHAPAGFAEPGRTELRNLNVVQPDPSAAGIRIKGTRRICLTAGEPIVRCDLQAVDGDLQAAAEILVGVIAQDREQAA